MIKKVKASLHEKLIFIFLILLGVFALGFTIVVKNKCLFVKNFDPQEINFEKPKNIVVLNSECGNVIIELYPEISPNGVERFKKLINLKAYDNVAFHRVIKDKLVQAGDLEFGKKNQLDYGKIGTGKSGFGTIKSEIDAEFDFERGSVGLARTFKI
jgi:peptidyl-prolyl cis-trans isomerase A (cyclophilin A)